MVNMSVRRLSALAALSLSLVLGVAQAQESDAYEPDPPDRAARLSYLDGDVSMQPAGEQDWAPALLNRPLTTGDKLWADQDSRAEIQVGPAAVRLDSDTGFSFLNVDDDTIQMRVTAGVISVSVRELPGNEHIEIDTPNIALTILRPGTYRVEVNDAGDTTAVKISEGEAEATGPGSLNVIVHAQETVTFIGEEQLTTRYARLSAPDSFDDWALERERRDQRLESNSSRYVGSDVTGYEDLDEYGSWSSEADYGYVWTPRRVSIGWSPYSYGRWVWVSPWGYTWIDDSPWGYAPFHYGRWAHLRNRWCWVPGPRHVRAVYAPALVGWSHGGGHGGHVGWFPLGPREVYVPGKRFSRRWVERVNETNTVVNRNHVGDVYDRRGKSADYRNRDIPGAVTVVAQNTFTSAGRTRDNRVKYDARDFSRDRTDSRPPQIQPVRESRFGDTSRRDVRRPPQRVEDRQVIVKRDPPPQNVRFARRPSNPERELSVVRSRLDRPDRDRPQRTDDKPANPVQREQPIAREPNVRERVSDPSRNNERTREDRPSREQREWRDSREQPVRQREWRDTQQREQPIQRQPEQRQQQPEQRPVLRERPVQREQPVQRQQPVRSEQPRQERNNPPPRAEQPRAERSEPKGSNQSFSSPKGGEGRPKANER